MAYVTQNLAEYWKDQVDKHNLVILGDGINNPFDGMYIMSREHFNKTADKEIIDKANKAGLKTSDYILVSGEDVFLFNQGHDFGGTVYLLCRENA